ncbi:NrtA/SsuA/CpmA family ABC transporter substrate-binding protein [Clostridium aestuarii]|uniref:NrtA/SsuA/CpmA family ABC transporter substrate-binding protein n=1 Tax=Clostridium aestuarii TaxID=338193 RepID=A0ABT4D1K1_9CLOT|nr:NrtA/SsuA/CpmA family ABC transporter substrate-binding protein [Clostridium aestuarii]MCY6485109.1 NrtA/SsuA/CpmA family ABC transporter substrate-binding protein [Clostridium aestuarii]
MKKIISIIVSVLMCGTIFMGCGSTKTSGTEKEISSSKQSVNEINISYVKLPLNVPSIIEKKEKLFEKEFGEDDIKITFPEITQGSKMTEALAAGSLDFCNALGGTSAILAAANGVDLKIIGIYSRAPKAFTIMAKDASIKTVEDLKSKKIAGPKGTILHQLLLGAAQKGNFEAEDIGFINMGIPEGVSAMMSEKVDAALVAGPAVSKALANGAHIITTGEGILDATIVIAVRGEFLRKYPELVKNYMKVHHESLKYMKENLEDTYKITAEETNIPIDEVKTMYKWYDFNSQITKNDIKELEKTQEFLKQNDMLTKTIDIKQIIEEVK